MPARPWTRLLAMLAGAAATLIHGAAAAADRFVPRDANFVVADLRGAQPDPELQSLMKAWRANPHQEPPALSLAAALIEHAREQRDPRYFGRAESLLTGLNSRPTASPAARRLYAEALQFRHDFDGAAAILDRLLRENRLDDDSRLRRASLRLTRGDFGGARADCAQVAISAGARASAGFACLAEAMAGSGEMARAHALLESASASRLEAPLQAYLLTTRGEIHEREGRWAQAAADYREALRLLPNDDALRAALADLLTLQGDVAGARKTLGIERPSLALLVRDAALASGAERETLIRRAQEWLELESARGDATHEREAALLALARGSRSEALAAARRNFTWQRELSDIRTLARCAVLAGDAAAVEELRRWLGETGYRDEVTEKLLAPRRRG